MRKNYVLDSSILVFDPMGITAFKGNNIIIPNSEIRKLERYTEDKRLIVRYQANDSLNFIKSILGSSGASQKNGVKINGTDIVLYILSSEEVRKTDSPDANEEEILKVLYKAKDRIKGENGETLKTILVSRTLSLRNLAISRGLDAEDYMADKILADNMFNGITYVEYDKVKDSLQKMYKSEGDEISCPSGMNFLPNEFVLIKCENGEIIDKFRYDYCSDTLKRVKNNRKKVYSIRALNDCQELALDLLFDPKVKLISLIGGPGTGKTLLSVASALQQVVPVDGSIPKYNKMIFIRPMLAAGEEMGFLPGNEMDKLRPWMGSLYDSIETLQKVLMKQQTEKHKAEVTESKQKKSDSKETPTAEELVQEFIMKLIERRKLEMMPTTYMRGRTFHDTIVIVDEAQGITPHVMKMILTRIGKNSKIIIAGDPSDNQIDTEVLASYFNGLICASQKMKGSKYSGIVELTIEDTERSNFVADVEKYM